jgi:hypothetical protein
MMSVLRLWVLLVLLFAAVAVAAGAALLVPSNKVDTIAWTQFGFGDQPMLIARALVGKGGDCPTIEIGGQRGTMQLRDDPRSAMFGKLCESKRPLGDALDVRIRQGGTVLLDQHVTRQPASVLMFGDTGCRVTSFFDQVCGDEQKWPFGRIAAAAARQPADLIVHLGDYLYREAACKGSSVPCIPGPYGDVEAAWRADFFTPARDLLAKAPWIFVRGNHEDCLRSGFGWHYYFSEGAAGCELVHPPAHIAFKGWSLVVFDSAHTDDKYAADAVNRGWLDLAAKLKARPPTGGPVLLATHEPGYFVCIDENTGKSVPCRPDSVAALGGVRAVGDAVRRTGARTILLSGHIHSFHVLDTQDMTQVIVGTGGARPDKVAKELEPPAIGDFEFEDRRLELTDGRWRVAPKGPTVTGKVQGWGASASPPSRRRRWNWSCTTPRAGGSSLAILPTRRRHRAAVSCGCCRRCRTSPRSARGPRPILPP